MFNLFRQYRKEYEKKEPLDTLRFFTGKVLSLRVKLSNNVIRI